MTAATYRTLLRVAMRHAYFTDGRLGQLKACPTPATAERLRRAGLLFRPQPAGFSVLTSQLTYRVIGEPLLFSLQAADPYFGNYSDLPPLAGPSHTYCLSPPPAGPAATPRLQAGPAVGAADQLPLWPLQTRQPVVAPMATTVELSRYPAGPILWQGTIVAQSKWLALDLRPWGSGRYQLRVGVERTIFYADDYLAATRPWGFLAFDDEVLTAKAAPDYVLSFAARPTYWQYQLVARNSSLPPALEISGDPEIVFKKVSAASEANACFRASQSIALAQRYSRPSLQLAVPAGPAGQPRRQVLWPVLPHAAPHSVRTEQVNNTTLFLSDIFVSL